MKTIATLILITLTCFGIKGQTAPEPAKTQPSGPVCTLKYAGTEWSIEHSDTAGHQCQTIAIAELPPMSQANTPMNLFINKMGSYSLKRAPELVIPDEYTIVIEDLLTGQYYNLKTQEPYTFKM
ncbi:MAG: hypothetical protein V4635_07305, partial [Bacteroidota bacterium]